MSRYLEILAVQRPFPFSVDESERTMFSCNFTALAAAPVTDWESEIMKILSNAGLATPGTDTFIDPAVTLPSGDGPYTQIEDTGGREPYEAHRGEKYERLSIHIVVRGKNYIATRARALAIWRALDGKRNVSVAA